MTFESSDANRPPAADGARPTTNQRMRLLLIAAAVIILDQFSKYLIESTLPLFQSWAPIPALAPVFRITHVSNTGIAFGLLPAGSSLFAWISLIVALAILVFNYTLSSQQKILRIALGLQLGGALGNLIDRLRIGHVTDFLDFGPWPVFNLADMSVVAGALILAYLFWQEDRLQRAEAGAKGKQGAPGDPLRKFADEPGVLDEWSTN